jgi:putative salt-induced outer membrane protein
MKNKYRNLANALAASALLAAASQPTFAAEATATAANPVWSGGAELTALLTSGNTDTQTLGVAGEVLYHPDLWSYRTKASYLTSFAQQLQKAELINTDLRAARNINPRTDLFVDANYLRNKFAGINTELGGDGGVGYSILAGEPHSLRAQVAAGYTWENLTSDDIARFATAKAGFTYVWKFSAQSDLLEEPSLIYNLSDSKDWRLDNTLAVSTHMTELLSLKISHNLFYRNSPVTGFKSTDTSTAVALVAKF